MPTRNPNNPPVNKKAFVLAIAFAETIREVGTAPLGPMYAAYMEKGGSLADFEAIMGVLVEAKLIRKTSETATWIGPKIPLSKEHVVSEAILAADNPNLK